jgi:redox-sensitive bicupin YhaK (pirin superfamily)
MRMNKSREVNSSFTAKPVTEGAGVKLYRVFGNSDKNITDPFLLMDNFGSDNPDDYIAGFPWHPHRGIETVTYMLEGEVEHEDSLGNKGSIHSGDVQWMTAGSGIIHQEMPKNTGKGMRGFQLWVNLPAKSKMMHPRYRDIKSKDIPVFDDKDMKVKIICGDYENKKGPVKDLEVDVEYMDFEIKKNAVKDIKSNPGHNVLIYIFEGTAQIGNENKEYKKGQLLIFGEGETIHIKTKDDGARFLYIGGKPLKEPIAWYGPIVMNTREELEIAFKEYSNGTFLKV